MGLDQGSDLCIKKPSKKYKNFLYFFSIDEEPLTLSTDTKWKISTGWCVKDFTHLIDISRRLDVPWVRVDTTKSLLTKKSVDSFLKKNPYRVPLDGVNIHACDDELTGLKGYGTTWRKKEMSEMVIVSVGHRILNWFGHQSTVWVNLPNNFTSNVPGCGSQRISRPRLLNRQIVSESTTVIMTRFRVRVSESWVLGTENTRQTSSCKWHS